jgi:Esterase/lipase
MAASLNQQVEEFLYELSEQGVPPLYRLSLPEARATYRDICVPDQPPDNVAGVRDRVIEGPDGDIRLRTYTPDATGSPPALVFYHGGGWMLGGLDTHDTLCRVLASEAEAVVTAVDYRLAPEHRFPAAVEDCYAATRWVAANAGRLGADPETLVTCGDSAGATLAAAVGMLARDRGAPELDYQVLAYPPTTHAFDTDSYRENAQGYFLTRDDMQRFWDGYLRSEADGRHPYASPLRAERLAGLPPTLVLTCGFDPLRDEGEALADQLDRADVSTTHLQYDDMIHGFLTMLADPALDRAREAVEELGAEIRSVT